MMRGLLVVVVALLSASALCSPLQSGSYFPEGVRVGSGSAVSCGLSERGTLRFVDNELSVCLSTGTWQPLSGGSVSSSSTTEDGALGTAMDTLRLALAPKSLVGELDAEIDDVLAALESLEAEQQALLNEQDEHLADQAQLLSTVSDRLIDVENEFHCNGGGSWNSGDDSCTCFSDTEHGYYQGERCGECTDDYRRGDVNGKSLCVVPICGQSPEGAVDTCADANSGFCQSLFTVQSGMFYVRPSAPMQVYCDMDTVDGPWMVIFNLTNTNNSPLTYSLSSNYEDISNVQGGTVSVSNSALDAIRNQFNINTLRFECYKPSVGRKIHLQSSSAGVLDFMSGRTGTRPAACGSYTTFADDNSVLSSMCSSWSCQGNLWSHSISIGADRLQNHSMFICSQVHFLITSGSSRQECDDYNQGTFPGYWRIYVK